MDRVAEGLGVPGGRLGAELYKLLVYRPGGFFAAHRDTEKIAGMVATLSLSLPTAGTGGELVVRHGDEETTFDMSAEEPSELAFAAFCADCPHEARPVTSGHSVTLVFNLFLRSGADGPPGAPDYADLTTRIAECLTEWRNDGVPEKLVWLLEHEYSEDGLSFDTLKNTDAAVAKVLREAADRAEFELNAAVLRIEEWGWPEFHPAFDRWGADWENDVSATMGEVDDRWEVLDGWAVRDGSRPAFGELPLNDGELLPRDALDDALPDEERLKGSTGNTGPTLELTYRYAALVAWPREKTVDILADAGIDGAVAWAATRCARARDTVDSTVRRLLRTAGEGDLATDFLRRVVMPNYDGSENEALAGVMDAIGPEAARRFLPGFADRHLPRQPKEIVTFLALAAERPNLTATRAWREVLGEVAGQALSSLGNALQAEVGARADGEDGRRSERGMRYRRAGAGAARHGRLDQASVRDLLVLASRFGLADQAVLAARAIADHPKTVTPDRMLPAALAEIREHEDMARTEAYGVLWRQAVDSLLARSSAPPCEPNDWTIAAEIPCDCELCARLRAFCRHPVRRVERFKVRKDLRKHLHQIIDRHRTDLSHETERRGSPYTLVCTKNRASHRRRLREYADDLVWMESLLASAPERERRETEEARRVVRLEQALAGGGGRADSRTP